MGTVRTFDSGATRDTAEGKISYARHLSSSVVARYCVYMNANRFQGDGTVRDPDNWKKGIPVDEYMESMWRHFHDVWTVWENEDDEADIETMLCALKFNVDGMLHEVLKDG
jgi:hypothetical protein